MEARKCFGLFSKFTCYLTALLKMRQKSRLPGGLNCHCSSFANGPHLFGLQIMVGQRPRLFGCQHAVEVLDTHSFKVEFSAGSTASKFFCIIMTIFVFLIKHFGATVFYWFSFVCLPLPKTCVHGKDIQTGVLSDSWNYISLTLFN